MRARRAAQEARFRRGGSYRSRPRQNRRRSGSRAKRQRHAPMVVVARLGRMGRALNSASIRRSISLVEVLPTDPVTATTFARARARPAAPSAVSPTRTSATRSGGLGHALRNARLTSAAAAPRARAARYEIVAVAHDRSGPRTGRPAAASVCRSTRPSRQRRACPPAVAGFGVGVRSRAIPSSDQPIEGRNRDACLFEHHRRDRHRPPTIWPVSWPLPAISSASPGSRARRLHARSPRRDLRPRSPRGRPHDFGADDGDGSSLRGLSSVTMTTSAFSPPPAAHQRALQPVAVAARAERRTTINGP
jgi:hypothetical protein